MHLERETAMATAATTAKPRWWPTPEKNPHCSRPRKARLASLSFICIIIISIFVLAICGFLAATCGFTSGEGGGQQRGRVRRTLVASLRSTAVDSSDAGTPAVVAVCPRCEDLFSRLEDNQDNPILPSRRDQDVLVTLRGEPKSGTGMMSSWAVGALARTCELLRQAFGEESCRVEPLGADVVTTRDGKRRANHEWTMVFDPQLSSGDRKCSCDTVGRVRVVYSNRGKHMLPVHPSCPWAHVQGIPSYSEGCKTLLSGEPVTNYDELRTCMQESPCELTDQSFQFATFRDPRAVAVSTYFWIETHAKDVAVYAEERVHLNRTLDESILEILESVCLWMSTRHILFGDLDRPKSAVFSYEEAEKDVLEWHYRWTHLAGLNLPVAWVKDIASLARGGSWASYTQGVNPHPGGQEASAARTWRDEVSPELWSDMDAVVRRWLPCDLVEGLGVPCTASDEEEGKEGA